MTEPSQIIAQAIREAQPDPTAPTILATVQTVTSSGVTVTFDGEVVASARVYRTLSAVTAGARVLMIRSGTTWVVGGVVATAPQIIKTAIVSVNLNANGDAAVTFPTAFPTACDSVQLTQAGDPAVFGALLMRLTNTVSTTAFVFRAYVPSTGASPGALAGVSVAYTAIGR